MENKLKKNMPNYFKAKFYWKEARAMSIFGSKSPKDTHGPVVKTGPTAGQNRSRNKDGAWRAKRSDAGQPRKKKD